MISSQNEFYEYRGLMLGSIVVSRGILQIGTGLAGCFMAKDVEVVDIASAEIHLFPDGTKGVKVDMKDGSFYAFKVDQSELLLAILERAGVQIGSHDLRY